MTRPVMIGIWAIAMSLCALTMWLFLNYAIAATMFPASLDIGEGVVLHQAMLVPGHAMYGDIFHYPFMVFEYPPVYLLAVRALALLGPNLLLAGRIVSLASTIICCVLLAYLVRRATGPSWQALAGAAIAASLPLTTLPVIAWVPLMRVDMLGLAFTLAGLVLVLESAKRRFLLMPAMIAFVAAVYTRQSDIAAPAASLCISLLRAPKPTLLACLFGLVLGLSALFGLDAATGGGFFRNVVVYLGHNSFDLANAVWQVAWWAMRYCTFWLLAIAGILAAWPQWRQLPARVRTNDASAVLAVMALYLLITTAMTLLGGKSGAWLNYLIEWLFAGAFWAGYACHCALARTSRHTRFFTPAVAVLLMVQMANGPLSITAWRAKRLTQARAAQNAELVARLKLLPDPVMADDMVALWQAGRDPGVETFMFAELARAGVLPEADLISLLQQKRFSAVITERGPGDSSFDSRYLPATQAALGNAYPRVETYGDFLMRLPAKER